MYASTSSVLVGVALYASVTVRRHLFCIYLSFAATPYIVSRRLLAGVYQIAAPYVSSGRTTAV